MNTKEEEKKEEILAELWTILWMSYFYTQVNGELWERVVYLCTAYLRFIILLFDKDVVDLCSYAYECLSKCCGVEKSYIYTAPPNPTFALCPEIHNISKSDRSTVLYGPRAERLPITSWMTRSSHSYILV